MTLGIAQLGTKRIGELSNHAIKTLQKVEHRFTVFTDIQSKLLSLNDPTLDHIVKEIDFQLSAMCEGTSHLITSVHKA